MTSNSRPAQSFNICALQSELAANQLAGKAQLQKELYDAVGKAEDAVGPEPKPGAGPRATPKGRHNLSLSKPPRVVVEIAGRAPTTRRRYGACMACPMRARGFVEHLAPSRDDRVVPAVEPPWCDDRAVAPARANKSSYLARSYRARRQSHRRDPADRQGLLTQLASLPR